MELRHLRYFVAVAEAEHFGKAAVTLGVSQSPLSRQIAQLEDEVGAPLFTHVGRGVKLSPAGKAFLEGARATLARAQLALEDARATAEGRVGTFVIGFDSGLAYTDLLPSLVSRFRARHPKVGVRLVSIESSDQVAALRAGTISVGYGYEYDPADDDPWVRHHVLLRDRLGVVLPKRHRLAAKRTLRIADLAGERFFWAPHAIGLRLTDAIQSAFRAHETPLVIHEENDGVALMTLVASGEGVTFFSESAAALVRVNATFKRVRDLDIVLIGRLSWRASEESDPLVRSLIAITRAM